MATQEAIQRRRANRKAARRAKEISRKLREVDPDDLERDFDTAKGHKQHDVDRAKHDKAWERFQKRRGAHPRYKKYAVDKPTWEAWVARVDGQDPAWRDRWYDESYADSRFIICKETREARASERRFRLAKLSMRQRYDAVQKGRKFDLN